MVNNTIIFNKYFRILIKQQIYNKLSWICKNHKLEMGCFLGGDIKENENEITFILDDLIIPNQQVSLGNVKTTGQDLVKLKIEYGERANRICCHQHSHNSLGSFFSTTDNTFMEQFIKDNSHLPFILFMVFSVENGSITYKTRIYINDKNIKGYLENVNIEIYDELSIDEENNLKNEIAKKVTKIEYPKYTSNYNGYNGYGYNIYNTDYANYGEHKQSKKKIKKWLNSKITFTYRDEAEITIYRITINDLDKFLIDDIKEAFVGYNFSELEISEGRYNLSFETNDKQYAIATKDDFKVYLIDFVYNEEMLRQGEAGQQFLSEFESRENKENEDIRYKDSDRTNYV